MPLWSVALRTYRRIANPLIPNTAITEGRAETTCAGCCSCVWREGGSEGSGAFLTLSASDITSISYHNQNVIS